MSNESSIREPVCIGYSDESMHNEGRWRSIGLFSVLEWHDSRIKTEARELLKESGIEEFKWQKVKTAKYRFGAEKLINMIFPECQKGFARVDVLIWDTHDSRHNVQGRDDQENLRRMYFQLINNIVGFRWTRKHFWYFYPDEMLCMKWDTLQDCVNSRSIKLDKLIRGFEMFSEEVGFKTSKRVREIKPCDSRDESLIQIADLFAGMAAYSYNSYNN